MNFLNVILTANCVCSLIFFFKDKLVQYYTLRINPIKMGKNDVTKKNPSFSNHGIMRERRRETHFSYLKNIVQYDILLNFKGNSIWLFISLFIKCKNMQSKCIRKVHGTSALSSQKLTLEVIQPCRLAIRGEINMILKQFTICNFVWGIKRAFSTAFETQG